MFVRFKVSSIGIAVRSEGCIPDCGRVQKFRRGSMTPEAVKCHKVTIYHRVILAKYIHFQKLKSSDFD